MPKVTKAQTLRTCNLRTSYKYYKTVDEEPVDINIYLKIVLGYMKFLMSKVFEGFMVELSDDETLGVIGIIGRKTKPKVTKDGRIRGAVISWGQTKKLWAEDPQAKADKVFVRCYNEHSDGNRFNIRWYVRNAKLKNKSYYTLCFTRTNRRQTSSLINSGKEYYVQPEKLLRNGRLNNQDSQQQEEGQW